MEDARRAEGSIVRWKRNGDGRVAPKWVTRYFLSQPRLPLIQATLVRGAFGASNTNASRYGDVAAIGTAPYVAVSSYAARLNSNAQRHHRLTSMSKHKPKGLKHSSTLSAAKDIPPGKWISQSDAARIRGVSPQAISDLVQKGRFRILKIGGKTFLDRREVQNYKTKRTGRPRK